MKEQSELNKQTKNLITWKHNKMLSLDNICPSHTSSRGLLQIFP